MQACKGAEEARRVYDALLGARGTAPQAEALQAPVLRLRLLRSLLHLVHLASVRLAPEDSNALSALELLCLLAP